MYLADNSQQTPGISFCMCLRKVVAAGLFPAITPALTTADDVLLVTLPTSNMPPGRTLAPRLPMFKRSGCPLAYVWPTGAHAEPYLGAAHGLMGILYVLLHCQQWLQQDQQATSDIRDCLR